MRDKVLRELRCRKVQAYLLVGVGLCVGYWFVRGSTWQSSTNFHTVLEVIATMLALMVGVIALVRYHSVKDNTILFIGTGFFGTALLDGFHAIVTSSHFKPMMPSDLPHLIPWSWVASRLFLSVLLCLSWYAWRRGVRLGKSGEISARGVYIAVGALTVVSFVFFVFAPLPRAYYPEFIFHRPEEFVPAFFFGLALVGYLRKGAWRTDPLEHWLVLSLIVGFLGQAAFMSFSGRLFDIEFDLAHNLKSVSYALVLTGLMTSMFVKFREVEASADTVVEANEAMRSEISERERAEAKLLKAEERTRMTLTTLVDAVLTIDRKGTITSINPAGVKMFGYEPLDLIDCNIKMLMTEDDRDHHDRYLGDYHKTGKATIIGNGREVVGRRKDGSTFPLELAVSEIVSAGEPGYTGILRDITERKKAEKKLANANRDMKKEIKVRLQAEEDLAKAEEQTRMTLATIVDAVLTIDKKGDITWINPAGVSMFGYELDELLGRNIKQLMTEDDSAEHDRYLSDYLKTGNATIIGKGREVVGLRKDGSTFPLELAVSELRTTGEPGYTGILRDITERKKAEDALALAQSRLVEAIESIPDGFAIYDADDRLVMANQILRDIHPGMGELYVAGRKYEDIIRAAADRGVFPNATDRLEDWVRERMRQYRGAESPPEVKSASGRWIKATDRPTKEGGTVSLRTDVTELKRREMELKRSNDELERFAYVASHDLQEPLRKIQAFGDRLATKYGEEIPEQGQDYITRMQDAAARMRTLISDLLDFARVTSSGKPFEQVDLNQIIEGVIGDLEIRLAETGAKVEIDDMPVITADPSQMRQLFQNLIGNALKFQREDTPPVIKVRLIAGATGMSGENEIIVEDNGIGFDEKHGARIFEMFQRLHNRSEYAGTGVGLAICRRIVQRHRGTIVAEGRPGEGASFRIRLPHQQEGEEIVNEAA